MCFSLDHDFFSRKIAKKCSNNQNSFNKYWYNAYSVIMKQHRMDFFCFSVQYGGQCYAEIKIISCRSSILMRIMCIKILLFCFLYSLLLQLGNYERRGENSTLYWSNNYSWWQYQLVWELFVLRNSLFKWFCLKIINQYKFFIDNPNNITWSVTLRFTLWMYDGLE